MSDYYKKNKEKSIKKAKKYYKEHKDEIRKKTNTPEHRARQRELYKKAVYRVEVKYSAYKRGAKARGLDFNLTIEQFKTFWQQPCSYCGEKIKTIGLDRIDSIIGYNIDNVTPCCTTCNRMKSSQITADFLERCKKIAEMI